MSRLRSAVAALSCAVLVLTGCTDEEPAASPSATPAPVSDFTIDCPTWSDPATEAGKDLLPNLQLECLGSEGLPVAISGKPDRPVVINIWGSWCPPCRDEMPLLVEVAALGEGKVDLLGIASLDTRTAATAGALDLGMTFPSVLDPKGQVVKSLGIPGMPVTLLLGTDGLIKHTHVGPFESTAEITEAIAEHLKVTL